ncbi:hypothetical protein ACLEBW_00110 [Klebsiella pneumoniae]|uniref:hypothetical protein n=1 Tax=Klebsiella pneumoniae TaxID=573 RepID=UPI0039758966
MSFFDELKASLEEAVEIKNGVREPARVTRYELADAYSKFTQQSFDEYVKKTHSAECQSIRGRKSSGGGRPKNRIEEWDFSRY